MQPNSSPSPSSSLAPGSERFALALICLSSAAVFILDLVTPLGLASWVFYLLPVLLTVQQPKPYLPYLIAGLQTVLLAAGFFLSPDNMSLIGDMSPEIAAVNRVFKFLSLFAAAILCHRLINERMRAQHLLWLERGSEEVNRSLLGELEVKDVANYATYALANYLGAHVGVLHRLEGERLIPGGGFAVNALPEVGQDIAIGQGLAGEVVRHGNPIVVQDLPEDHIRISSASGHSSPRQLVIAPITADDKIIAVLELGFLRSHGTFEQEFELLKQVSEHIGIALRAAQYRQHLRELLEETQRQSEELQNQQEELRVTNEELQEQGRALQESQTFLEVQQTELEQSNVQLEERTQLLERQKSDLMRIQQQMEINAIELDRANRYKSEFLANMSHELRTPLNSSLILSHMLAENKPGTLTQDQVRYARTIHASNNDLLTLINDILDLSKIEAGQVEMQAEKVMLTSLIGSLRQTFEPIAAQKSIPFKVVVSDDAPTELTTDEQRLQQVIKNLLSNAFKFTEKGEVSLLISAAPNAHIAFAVRDTGIGIPEQQQSAIFKAFRQADGSTSRTYGGTGLGLSISRELTQLLGGQIQVKSNPGIGSTFTLEIPQRHTFAALPDDEYEPMPAPAEQDRMPQRPLPVVNKKTTSVALPAQELTWESTSIADDRDNRQRERLILVVEDDTNFAQILYDLVHEMHFDCIHAPDGETAFELAQTFQPHAILLDVGLPDYSGLSVLERMKHDPSTRHIPVHIISVDDYRQTALKLGAVGYALKPVAREEIIEAIEKLEDKLSHRVNQILIVEDNASLRESLGEMLGTDGTRITSAGTAAEALEHLADSTFDCMVMDLMLPDASGYDILEKISHGAKYAFPPVIVYTGRTLSREEEERLRRYSQSIIIKGARSPERLLDEVSLFLHRVESSLPPEQQQMLRKARQRDAAFEGRRILVAEDDVRNIFALTSVFEPLGVELEITRNGKEALARLALKQDIDLVLMDLMMPEMDGLTAMCEIRKQPQFKLLPIIALTAKAMVNDRQECLDAGANDYISKPINVDQLISLCRVWMPK